SKPALRRRAGDECALARPGTASALSPAADNRPDRPQVRLTRPGPPVKHQPALSPTAPPRYTRPRPARSDRRRNKDSDDPPGKPRLPRRRDTSSRLQLSPSGKPSGGESARGHFPFSAR